MAPERTCVGCRRTCSSDQLDRVARVEGRLVVGRGQPGRGAWLCRDSPACLEEAVRRRAFDRALRCRLPGSELDRIRAALGSPGEVEVGPGSEGSVL